MKKRIAFSTLGCRLNQFETDALVTRFRNTGYEIVPFDCEADAYVINTCTVTDKSDRKSRNTIYRAGRWGHAPVVVTTGCYTENHRKYLKEQLGVTYVVDNQHKNGIFTILDAHFRGEIVNSETMPGDQFDFDDTSGGFHTRRMVKIQDGCDNFCSFCIIPSVRGAAISRPFEEVLDGIKNVIDSGGKEIVLTGVNISRYQYGNMDFTELVSKILELPGEFRLRISSIEPDLPASRFIDLVNHPKFCRHLHLCFQSGSDRILRSMNRQYSYSYFRNLVEGIRSRSADFNLTTDIMVGFPGETDSDFEETCRAVEAMRFSHIHTFPYSVRTGTTAAHMDDQIPGRLKAVRAKRIRELSEKQKEHYFRSLLGMEQTVLVEKVENGQYRGYGDRYVPVTFEAETGAGTSSEKLINTFQRVYLTSLGAEQNPVIIGCKL